MLCGFVCSQRTYIKKRKEYDWIVKLKVIVRNQASIKAGRWPEQSMPTTTIYYKIKYKVWLILSAKRDCWK